MCLVVITRVLFESFRYSESFSVRKTRDRGLCFTPLTNIFVKQVFNGRLTSKPVFICENHVLCQKKNLLIEYIF